MSQNGLNAFIYENQNLTDLVSALYNHLRGFGYDHIQLPAIENADIFITKAGDQVITSLFAFERNGKQLALRPEFTALAAFRYAQQHPHTGVIARWQFNGSVFRDDVGENGSRYQHMSFGAELIGDGSPLADAEIVAAAATGLLQILPGAPLNIVVGHTGLVRRALAQFDLDPRTERFVLNHLARIAADAISTDELLVEFDQHVIGLGEADLSVDLDIEAGSVVANAQKMLDIMLDATESGSTMGGRTREDIVRRMLQKRQRASEKKRLSQAVAYLHDLTHIVGPPHIALQHIGENLPLDDADTQTAYDAFSEALHLMSAYALPSEHITVNLGLVRDWNYYTGMVFDIFAHQDGQVRLGGGGRYDELIRLMGGASDCPAVGFAYYMDNIISIIHHYRRSSGSGAAKLTITCPTVAAQHGIAWAQSLRAAGFVVILASLAPLEDDSSALRVLEDGSLTYNQQTFSQGSVTELLLALNKAGITA